MVAYSDNRDFSRRHFFDTQDLDMNASRWIHEMTWVEIEKYLQSDDIALIPVGATEQHGRHMALFTDTGWAVGLCEGVATQANALIAPPVHYGWGPHHMAYPGTITLRSATLTQLCIDIGESLAYHGFRKLIFVNGNRVANLPAMQLAASKLRFATGAFVAVADAGLLAKKAIRELCTSPLGGLGHAGESETSYMLHHWPHLVDMSEAQSIVRKHGRFSTSAAPLEPPFDGESVYVPSVDSEFRAATESAGGLAGDATASTAEKGRLIHEALCTALTDFIQEVVQPKKISLKEIQIPT